MNADFTVFRMDNMLLRANRIYDHEPSSIELTAFIIYCKEKYPKYEWACVPVEAKRDDLYYVSCYAL